jgi:branched-chain amino acid aminotransferase
MATVFLNGRFVPQDEARVSAFDAGLQHAVGLFETMIAVQRAGAWHVLHLHEHIARLSQSARILGLSDSLRTAALSEAVERTVRKAGESLPGTRRLRVRLTVTGGDLNLLGRPERESLPGLMIVAQPATEYPPEMFERGVLATLAEMRANPLDPMQGHKTLNYWGRLRELQEAARRGAGEALVFGITNHLVGGCVSNAFVIREGIVMTPVARGEEEEVASADETSPEDVALGAPAPRGRGAVLPSPVLPGIVRRWVMDWALAEGVECRRRYLTLEDVLRADEVFLTNSSWGVLPVVRLEAETIARGEVGEITRRLVDAWRQLTGLAGQS